MRSILERVFTLFGKGPIGQLAGAAAVGATLTALVVMKNREPAPGGFLVWILGGATVGFLGGLILLSPRRFFGSILTLVSLAITVTPMSHGDGSSPSLQENAIKYGIGAGMTGIGIWLLARAWKRAD